MSLGANGTFPTFITGKDVTGVFPIVKVEKAWKPEPSPKRSAFLQAGEADYPLLSRINLYKSGRASKLPVA